MNNSILISLNQASRASDGSRKYNDKKLKEKYEK